MIFGFIAAFLFLLVSLIFFTKKMGKSKFKKFIVSMHKPIGYILIFILLIHLLITLPLIRQRPIAIYILGFIMILTGFISILSYWLRKRFKNFLSIHKLCAFIMLVCLIPHIILCVTSLTTYQKMISNISISSVDLATLKDGDYIGECDVEYIYAKVKVTVKQNQITNIEILKHLNEKGKSAEALIETIIHKQDTSVDAVSGATNSSKVIMKAVEHALSN